jgi:ubiquinone/menaquinone biosynthesis C-methylase UbiE
MDIGKLINNTPICWGDCLRDTFNEVCGIPCFGGEEDGDYFDRADFDKMVNGRFRNSLKNDRLLKNTASRYLLDEIIGKEKYVIDLACGPGMGLIPQVKQLKLDFPCMATDANLTLLKEWKAYLENNSGMINIDFAQFSLFDIPIKNDSVKAYSSFIGISSTRNGSAGYDKALSEIYRTLVPGGKLYTIETEWTDIPAILDVFDKMNQKPWPVFLEKQKSWHDRFIDNGFEIEYEEVFEYHNLTENDNELGAAAKEFGIEIGQKIIAFIVSKM